MGFVSERLNAQLRAIDAVFHLDPEHDDLSNTFTILFGQASVSVEGRTQSNAVRIIWDVLQSPTFRRPRVKKSDDSDLAEDHLPPLTEVAERLRQVREALFEENLAHTPSSTPNSDHTNLGPLKQGRYPLAELAFLSKVAAVLHAHLLHRLVTASSSLPPHVSYWRDQEISNIRAGYYLLQTLPRRIYRYAQLLVASVRSQQPHHLRPQFQIFSKKLLRRFGGAGQQVNAASATFLGLGLRRLRPPTVFELARQEIRCKREKLEIAREVEASCLGLLADHGVDIKPATVRATFARRSAEGRFKVSREDVAEAAKEVQATLSKVLILMTASLDKVTRVADDMSPEEEVVWADVSSLEEDIGSTQVHSIADLYDEVHRVYTSFITFDWSFDRLIRKYGRPSRITRYWLPAATGAFLAYSIGSTLALRWDDVVDWVDNLRDTISSFFTEWIVKPLQNVYTTIRHKEAQLAITSSESLNADLKALEKMVVEYARDHGVTDPLELTRIGEQAQHGDMSLVLQQYAEELKAPFKNALSGDLVRALLIQIQKAKVDGELAISALDKLLRSNELNFAFLAVMPSILLTWSLVSSSQRLWRGSKEKNREKTYRLVRGSLRNIDRLLNRANQQGRRVQPLPHQAHGLLLCEVYLLRRCVPSIPRRENYRQNFVEDLRELEGGANDTEWTPNHEFHLIPDSRERWTVTQRMETVKRMWRTYPFVRGVPVT
ncbi:hypothetical protein SpCBS45565_g07910 [Spizellomyces sp. 'palustris']|nr:hypothetical protein SpCBS45565_g07910 [Spizellomyces sp. 'palustris']